MVDPDDNEDMNDILEFMASYDEELKKRIVRMHLEEGLTIKSLSEEYYVSENGIWYWLKKYCEECSNAPAAKENTTS